MAARNNCLIANSVEWQLKTIPTFGPRPPPCRLRRVHIGARKLGKQMLLDSYSNHQPTDPVIRRYGQKSIGERAISHRTENTISRSCDILLREIKALDSRQCAQSASRDFEDFDALAPGKKAAGHDGPHRFLVGGRCRQAIDRVAIVPECACGCSRPVRHSNEENAAAAGLPTEHRQRALALETLVFMPTLRINSGAPNAEKHSTRVVDWLPRGKGPHGRAGCAG